MGRVGVGGWRSVKGIRRRGKMFGTKRKKVNGSD